MNIKRIISLTLAAAVALSGSLTVWATETEFDESQIIEEQVLDQEEDVEYLTDGLYELLDEPEQGDQDEVIEDAPDQEPAEEIIEDLEEIELTEAEEELEEEMEVLEDSDNGYGSQLSTDTSGDTELYGENPELIGYIVDTGNGIQTYAETEYTPYTNYTYDYQTFTKTVDGHSGDEILDKTVEIVVSNEGNYTTVLANDNNSGALSIGKIGWHANYALTLVRLIVVEDNATAWDLLGEELYNEIISSSTSWSSRILTNDEVTIFKNFLDPDKNPASKTIQDKLARSYVASYANNGYNLGIRNAAALVYYADIENQYGIGPSGSSMGGSSTCVTYATVIAGGSASKVTLNELHLAAVANVAHNYASRSNVGSYLERRRSTYGKLATCGWTYCNSGDYIIPYDSVWSSGSGGSAWLQVALNTYTNAGLTVTGVYDDALKSAVKAYQEAVGLDADGLAGLHTTTKLIHDMYYDMVTTGASMGSVDISSGVSSTGTDIVKIDGVWTYTVDGTADYTYTGLAKNSNGWYYVKNGIVDFTYTGFASNSNGSWYVEGSKVKFNMNSVIKDTTGAIGDKGTWYYVVDSKVQYGFTGLANYKNENGWWYIKDGVVDFTANGVYKNQNGWYYVDGGKVRFDYNGFATNSNGKWYVEDGRVRFNKNSVIKDTTGAIGTKGTWYYVVGNKVQTDFTGLAHYKNENGWWYIQDGEVDFSAHTVAKNQNGWYYVDGGKVRFDYNGFATNSNGKWYVEDGRVKFNKNSVIKDTAGAIGEKGTWYYVVGNKVQTDFTGLANYKNENGWWYIKNGEVDFTFYGIAKNNNGWWYIKNGKVDFSFTGTVKANGTTYSVTNGKVAM